VYENYLSSGFCHEPTAEDPRGGVTELVLYNPTSKVSEATLTVYFEDREPCSLSSITVQAETNALAVMPRVAPEVFADCGFWGARVLSTTPLVLNVIGGVHITRGKRTFSGGVTNFRGTKLHHQWHFPDGLWLEWKKFHQGDVAKAKFPFNELEHYHFLNPHPRDAEVTMTLQFRTREQTTMHFTVKAERMFIWENIEKVPHNRPYGVKIVSSESISTSAVRYVYGLHGLEEWGMQVHCAMWGVPGPLIDS
jgi:hypothetical protein